MPLPWLIPAGIAAANVVSQLLRKKRGKLRPFEFTPDPNDPELALRRRAALEEIGRGRSRDISEIGRAGLLGSSAAFGILGEGESRGARVLEDIPSDIFAKRRLEALGLYRDEASFQRERELQELRQSGRERLLSLQSLGNLGEDIGGFVDEESLEGMPDFSTEEIPPGMDYYDYIQWLRRRKALEERTA